MSDHPSYRSFCALAAADDGVFRAFRASGGAYTDILEHVPEQLARDYADHLRLSETGDPAELELAAGDHVGAPRQLALPNVGMVTGSVLRYLCVAREIKSLLGTSEEVHFLEVGVGYGGQVRVLARLFPGARFTLVDLPETLLLARRFLESSEVGAQISYLAASEVRPVSSDFFISNYALSELRRGVQERYLNNLVAFAGSGYVTWNSIAPRSFRSISAADLARRVGGTVSPEVPLSYPGNEIVTWTS